MKTSSEIREAFLSHFEKLGHQRLPSGSLVPANDPTLMFANAGMVPFKDVFLGKDKRPYKRATTSQKCIRISGKHNDLENVGFTARHHTFFEMLGNFSFGDYFKKEAIEYAWSFFTETLKLPKEKLVVTVFGGEGGLEADEEAARLWTSVAKVPEDRIIRLGMKDNFWQMGDTGPCGPCSEIHYFVGDGTPDLKSFGEEPGADGRGWVELWNLVFMQFDRSASGEMRPLPAPSIDTGAGLERLAAACQNVVSNYDTDLLKPLVMASAKLSGKTYGATLNPDDVSMRVIADHARTAAFLIAEGVFPDKEDRPYVLRRVMRRAIRHGHRLGIHQPFLHEVASEVVNLMGGIYPELRERSALIIDVTKQEEERFRRTLKRGLELLEENTDWSKTSDGSKMLPGRVAFTLSDTYGFPLDLQDVIGGEQGFQIDHPGFESELEKARERSAGSKVGDAAVQEVWKDLQQKIGDTKFVGYEGETHSSKVLALVVDGRQTDAATVGQSVSVILNATPFYGESGGQVGDAGVLTNAALKVVVSDTQKPSGSLFVHHGQVESGAIKVGDTVAATVDHGLRSATRRNHSATHLLHFALRKVLGDQSMQKGSLVSPERLRFDYSASKAPTPAELQRIEDLVNEKILLNAPIETETLPMDEAKARGAIGIFEEKYGDVVRMLTMTADSIELCGGTHATRTGDLGVFKIVSEGGIAAGVRRVEAVTGEGAFKYLRGLEETLRAASERLKTAPGSFLDKLEKTLEGHKEVEQKLKLSEARVHRKLAEELTAHAVSCRVGRFVGANVTELDDPKALRELAEAVLKQLGEGVAFLGCKTTDGKASLICAVSKKATSSVKAGDVVKAAAALVGGTGGGKPELAQAGGTDPTKLDAAIEATRKSIVG